MSLIGSRSVWNQRQIVHEAFDRHRDYITHETLTLHIVESPSANAFFEVTEGER